MNLDKLRRSIPGVSAFVLTAAFIGAIWMTTISLVAEEKKQAFDDAVAESNNLSSIIAASLNEMLGRAVDHARNDVAVLKTERNAKPLIGHQSDREVSLLHIAVFDDDANIVYSQSPLHAERGLRQLARFVAEDRRLGRRSAGMIFGQPLNSAPSESLKIPIAVPLYSTQQKLRGVLAAYVDLGNLLKPFEEVSKRSRSMVRLFDAHGNTLAEVHEGKWFAGIAPEAPSHSAHGIHDQGAGATASFLLRAQERISGHKMLDHVPLGVAVLRDPAEVVSRLRDRHELYYVGATLLSAIWLVMMAALIGFKRRQNRLYQGLAYADSNRRELIEQLETEKVRAFELASYDFLTGLPNRMMFHRMAAAELSRARRSRKIYALFFLDLDKFKTVNDTLGHAAGDILLKAVASRLRTALREYDLVARLGGDEFAVLVSEVESIEKVGKIAAKLVESLSAPYTEIDGHILETTPSIGIALYPGDGQDVNGLLSHADAAMYNAKRSGRGTYRFYDGSLNPSSARKLELISRFRRAIRDNEFRLHYQLRIGLEDMQPVGMEALVRWQHPTHGLIYPGEFIDLAEEHDFIVPLGHWAIDAACAQVAEWRELGIPLLPVAINISAKQLRDEKLVDVVVDALERHAISPSLIEMEVTESCFLERPEIAKRVLVKLHTLGIKISLDDYGTGFSGLSHLKQLPIAALKIDRSFIRDIRNDISDAMIVSSTISLSHSLGMKVVAEGVETKEQLVHLKAAGCDEVQGFYCHRPAEAKDIASGLQKFSISSV